MSRRPRSLLGRFISLVRGAFAGWVREREERSPSAVYEQAIAERTRHYADLKRAVAGILYMRNKLEGEITHVRTELARTHEDIRTALRKGDDRAALALVRHKQSLVQGLERNEQEVERIRSEASEAKGNLAQFREEIRTLEREKVRMLATLANAQARRRIQEAFEGFSLDGEMRALEGVREYVARVRAEGQLNTDAGEEGLDGRIRQIRSDAQDEAARRELDELKRRLVPAALAQAAEREVEVFIPPSPVTAPAQG